MYRWSQQQLAVCGVAALLLVLEPALAATQSGKPAPPDRSGAAVCQAISQRGAPAVFRELFSDDQGWATLLTGITSGDSGWLCVAKGAQGTVEAGGAQELQMAVARALEANPGAVLQLLKDGYSGTSAVCGLQGIEDDLPPHFDDALAMVARRRASVKTVGTASLRSPRRDCLTWLDRLEANMRKNKDRWFVPR